jgi:hypothetical protein
VGDSGFNILPGVPGDFSALFNGDFGGSPLYAACCSTGNDECAAGSLSPIYPNPTSDGFGPFSDSAIGDGSANGDFPVSLRSMGELTEVASANRGVRGGFSDRFDELDEVRDLATMNGFF